MNSIPSSAPAATPTRPLGSTRWEPDLDSLRAEGIAALLRGASVLLTEAGVPSPEADARALLAHAWSLDPAGLSRKRLFDEPVPEHVIGAFADLCASRCQRIPLQHLTGLAHFRHLELEVGPGVFVPRPETELLVSEALDELSRLEAGRTGVVIDLCSGSGAIALALATERPGLHVIGVESEPAALEWSRRNLSRTDLGESTVELIAGDATRFAQTHPELHGAADVVVTNPPYVPDAAIPRDPEVRDYDPAAALYGGETGLEIPALLIAEAEALLRPGGLFLMEHSEEQGPATRELLERTASLRQARTFPDYTGRDRCTVARRRPETSR